MEQEEVQAETNRRHEELRRVREEDNEERVRQDYLAHSTQLQKYAEREREAKQLMKEAERQLEEKRQQLAVPSGFQMAYPPLWPPRATIASALPPFVASQQQQSTSVAGGVAQQGIQSPPPPPPLQQFMQPPPGAPPRLAARPPPVPPPPLAGPLPPPLLSATPAQAIQQPPTGLPPPVAAAQVVPLNVAPVPAATVPGGSAIPQPASPRPNIAQFIANLGWRNRAQVNLTAPFAAPPLRPPPMIGLGPAAVAAGSGGPPGLGVPVPPPQPLLTSGPWAPPPLLPGSGTQLPPLPMPWPQALVSPASTFLNTAATAVQSALPLSSPLADPQALQDDLLLAAIASRRPALATMLGFTQTQSSPPALSGQSLAAPQFDMFAAPLAPATAASLGYLTPGGQPVGAMDLWAGDRPVAAVSVVPPHVGAAATTATKDTAGMTAVGGLGPGALRAPGPPGDPDGDPDKKKRDKDIDNKRKGEFQISSETIQAAKGRSSRGMMKCEVERFERGTDLTIKDWINQMETYFSIGQVPPEAFVGFMMMKIVPKHLNEIKQYKDMDYLPFREKLIEVFAEPDLATAYLSALSGFSQERDETIAEYMLRLRLLVLKAHPDMPHAHRERILITSFVNGLYDRQLAASLAVVKPTSASEAQRIASEGEAVRRETRSRRTTTNVLADGASGGRAEEDDDDYGEVDDDEGEEDISAALGDARFRRGNNSYSGQRGERRKATSATKCYGCDQYGHYKADCPRLRSSGGGRQQTRAPLSGCLLCGGDHFAKNCPQLALAKRAVAETAASSKADKTDIKPVLPPRPSSSDPGAVGKKDSTMVLAASGGLARQATDTVMPAMSEESTPGTPRMQLFFVLGAVQSLPVWILADSGSVRNLDRRVAVQTVAVPTPDSRTGRRSSDWWKW